MDIYVCDFYGDHVHVDDIYAGEVIRDKRCYSNIIPKRK